MATKSVKTNKSEEQVEMIADKNSIIIPSDIEFVKGKFEEMDIDQIRECISYGLEIIKSREDEELAEIDRQMADLRAKRDKIRPKIIQVKENKRNIKALINPKNPEQKYTVGIRPKWLEDWLKETLGDKVNNKGAVYEQIAKWKNEQQ